MIKQLLDEIEQNIVISRWRAHKLLFAEVKVHMARKISHLKTTLIFFVPEMFKFSNYANLVTGDVIGCASTVV